MAALATLAGRADPRVQAGAVTSAHADRHVTAQSMPTALQAWRAPTKAGAERSSELFTSAASADSYLTEWELGATVADGGRAKGGMVVSGITFFEGASTEQALCTCPTPPERPPGKQPTRPPGRWARCKRECCPCTASWNGEAGEFCCLACRDDRRRGYNGEWQPQHGRGCWDNYHSKPFTWSAEHIATSIAAAMTSAEAHSSSAGAGSSADIGSGPDPGGTTSAVTQAGTTSAAYAQQDHATPSPGATDGGGGNAAATIEHTESVSAMHAHHALEQHALEAKRMQAKRYITELAIVCEEAESVAKAEAAARQRAAPTAPPANSVQGTPPAGGAHGAQPANGAAAPSQPHGPAAEHGSSTEAENVAAAAAVASYLEAYPPAPTARGRGACTDGVFVTSTHGRRRAWGAGTATRASSTPSIWSIGICTASGHGPGSNPHRLRGKQPQPQVAHA